MKYPMVMGEFETLHVLAQGYSISRFGDGELKILDGKGYRREPANKALTREIRNVLDHPDEKCLIGIPTLDPAGPKYGSWLRHQARFERLLTRSSPYFSAFISRPDSAPWIRTRGFAVMFRRLWLDKRVAVVCEKDSGTLRAIRPDAKSVEHVECPSHGAYAHIDAFEHIISQISPQIAFLSCGPTASCLANRLASRGIQTIDFGSGGSFLAKLLQDE